MGWPDDRGRAGVTWIGGSGVDGFNLLETEFGSYTVKVPMANYSTYVLLRRGNAAYCRFLVGGYDVHIERPV